LQGHSLDDVCRSGINRLSKDEGSVELMASDSTGRQLTNCQPLGESVRTGEEFGWVHGTVSERPREVETGSPAKLERNGLGMTHL
jgi:hypothetical protein